jgi:hypothetical protein
MACGGDVAAADAAEAAVTAAAIAGLRSLRLRQFIALAGLQTGTAMRGQTLLAEAQTQFTSHWFKTRL